jgi:hypothetical protein
MFVVFFLVVVLALGVVAANSRRIKGSNREPDARWVPVGHVRATVRAPVFYYVCTASTLGYKSQPARLVQLWRLLTPAVQDRSARGCGTAWVSVGAVRTVCGGLCGVAKPRGPRRWWWFTKRPRSRPAVVPSAGRGHPAGSRRKPPTAARAAHPRDSRACRPVAPKTHARFIFFFFFFF